MRWAEDGPSRLAPLLAKALQAQAGAKDAGLDWNSEAAAEWRSFVGGGSNLRAAG